jgi:hypothetical protein
MQYAQVVEVRDRTLVLSFDHPPIERQFKMRGDADVLIESLREVLGVEWTVETLASSPAAQAAVDEPVAADDPTVDLTDSSDAPSGDDAAVALLEENLGATVIGEVDAS